MTDASTYSKIKTKINIESLEKIGGKDSMSRLSNAVCIENLVKKNSLFAPSRLEPMIFDKTIKPAYNLKAIKCKKQIEPHQPKIIIPHIGKSMSSLFNESKPQLKESRHRRNISAIWQNKKMSRQKKTEANQPPPTASFYLKKGDNPVFYELKMDIKKVDTLVRPIQSTQKKMMRNKYRNRNFPLNYDRVSSKQLNIEQNNMQQNQNKTQIQAKRSLQIHLNKQIFTQTDIGSDKHSVPIKLNFAKERYIKSTLISYSSKGKNKKNKESLQIVSELYNVKNILGLAQQMNQQTIQIMQQPIYFVNGFDSDVCVEQLNQKSANCVSVCLFHRQTHAITPIMVKDPYKRVQIASITKVMTCLLILNIIRIFRLNVHHEKVLVGQKASKMPGTSAGLTYSDILTVYDLLHGLMLPSGNDAAIALAEWGGKNIRKYCSLAQKFTSQKAMQAKQINFVNQINRQRKSHIKLFIHHMNKAAGVLKLKNTFFANSHGLMNERAYSCSNDVTILTCMAMKNPIFFQIVGKKQYTCRVNNRTYSQFRNVSWRNTNRLLNTEGFVGVKTGVTPSAGPCLSSMFKLNQNQSIVIVVLKTKSMEARFRQSVQLLKESLSYLTINSYECLFGGFTEDDQSTSISLENEKAEQANLVDQKQLNSDQQNDDEDEEDQ